MEGSVKIFFETLKYLKEKKIETKKGSKQIQFFLYILNYFLKLKKMMNGKV